MKRLIFVSSVQDEFAKERRAIRYFVHGNRLLGRHFDVFLFEDPSPPLQIAAPPKSTWTKWPHAMAH